MSKQEDFHRPEKPLEKAREIDNKARISKEAEIKRKFNRNQKGMRSMRHPAKLSLIFSIASTSNRTKTNHHSLNYATLLTEGSLG